MKGHIEPLSGVLRVGGAYGEPYTWAAPLRYLSPFEVEVMGAVRAPEPNEWREALEVLRADGVRVMTFVRCKSGTFVRHRFEL